MYDVYQYYIFINVIYIEYTIVSILIILFRIQKECSKIVFHF